MSGHIWPWHLTFGAEIDGIMKCLCSLQHSFIIYVLFDACYRQQEQEENPTAVRQAVEAYDKHLRSIKHQKYIGDTSSSTDSNNDESGISSDESPRTTEISETVSEHSQVTREPSATTVGEDTAAGASVSTISCYLPYEAKKLHSFIFAAALLKLYLLRQFLAHTYLNKFLITPVFHTLYIIRDGEPA